MMNDKVKISIKYIAWDIYFKACTYAPIDDNKIFYESFLGKSYSDNPKALYEHINSTKGYKAIWSVERKHKIPGNAKQVKRLGIKYFYHLATAKYIITNSRMPKEFVKSSDQVLVQTWHGTPLKKLVHDVQSYSKADQDQLEYLQNFDNDVQQWDYLISQNAYSTSKFKSAFKYEGEILEYGYPRNDILNNYDDLTIKLLKEQYGIKNDEKVLLYTPTYRDNQVDDNHKYVQQIKLDLDLLQKRVGNWKIIIKVHYLIAKDLEIANENVILAKISTDINDLMLMSDCLLTDYSSIMFDFANLKKPMIFFAYDFKEYEKEIRGFYQDYQMMICGKNIKNTNELIKILKNFNNYKNQYSEQLKLFATTYTSLDDGQVSEKIIKKIIGEK